MPPALLLQLHPLSLRPLLLLRPLLFLNLQLPLRCMPGSQALRLCPPVLHSCSLLRLGCTSGGTRCLPPLSLGCRGCLLLRPQRLAPRLGSRLLLILGMAVGWKMAVCQ